MNDFKPIMTQEELDRIIKERLKRERKKGILDGLYFIKRQIQDVIDQVESKDHKC